MAKPEAEQRVQTACMLIVAALAIGVAMYWLRSVMIPFVLALFFAAALSPLIDFQIKRLRMPRPLAMLGTLVLGLGLMLLLWVLISTSVSQLMANRDGYQKQFELLVERTTEALPLHLIGFGDDEITPAPGDDDFDTPVTGTEPFGDGPPVAEQHEGESDAMVVGGDARAESAGPPGPASDGGFDAAALFSPQTIRNLLIGTTNAIMGVLSQSIIVLIFVLFLLLGGGKEHRPLTGVAAEIKSQIQRYLSTKLLTSGCTGVLVGLTLAILGVDLAMVFGVFAFLLNFIPSLGSIIATLLPLPVVLVSPDISLTVAVLAIAIPGAIQFSVGNIIEPKILGQSLDLHPVVILLALILWGTIWGLVGMLLAAPITGVIKIMLQRIELTQPVANLLAGRLPGDSGTTSD